MSDDPRSPLMQELDALGVWTLASPPADFAERVLDELPLPVEPSRRRAPWAVGIVAVVLAGCLGWWLTGRTRLSSGAVVATQRRTLPLAGDSVVVAETGAALRWFRRAEGVVVEQTHGAAFYRIDPDDAPLEVRTPAGDVQVLGTCFSVQLEEIPMSTSTSRNTKSIALGATLAVAATVTVYEGRTVLANDSGSVRLSAGERGTAVRGTPPRIESSPPPVTTDSESTERREVTSLRAQARRQAEELEALRTKLAKRDASEAESESSAAPPRFAAWGPPIPEGFDHYAPTHDALLEMAECGIVAWDQPPVWADDGQPDPEYLDALGLTPEERTAFVGAFDTFRAETVAQARAFYIELGGDPSIAEEIDPSELVGIVYGKTDLDSREESRIALAMERAGLAEAPRGEGATSERLLRWDADLGNAFERALGETFGAERAASLRAARGGWPGKRVTWADLCTEKK